MKLTVKNLVKKFKSTVAVNNISFEIEKNKTLGLLGPNGCGKTTSIGMMLGLITPTQGEIFIDGIQLNSENRIKLLSFMNFASPYIELPKKLTVKQNLEVYARMYGVNNKIERIDELIEDLNLSKFLHKNTGELSSGQKNRVSLAKSLINKPKLLFLDEPTAGLDPDSASELDQLVLTLRGYLNLTVVMVTHDLESLSTVPDRICFMGEGKIIANSPLAELVQMGHPLIEQYFSSDRAQRLIKNG